MSLSWVWRKLDDANTAVDELTRNLNQRFSALSGVLARVLSVLSWDAVTSDVLITIASSNASRARFFNYKGDLYLTTNCSYNTTTGLWNRDDVTKAAYVMAWYTANTIPGEAATGGQVFWIAVPNANPIGNNITTMAGFSAAWIVTQFRDYVIGGYGIEIDGKGVVPYARMLNNVAFPPAWGNANYAGACTNLFVDFSGRDRDNLESWFWGVVDNSSWYIKRMAPNADYTLPANLKTLVTVNTQGNLTARDLIADRGDGTGVCFLNGAAGTRYLFYDGTSYTMPAAKLSLDSGLAVTGGAVNLGGTTFGALGATPVSRPTVTGSRAGNAALASLLTAIANLGLITDSSTA